MIRIKLKELNHIKGYNSIFISLHKNKLPNTNQASNVLFNGRIDCINTSLIEVMEIDIRYIYFLNYLYPKYQYCLIFKSNTL